MSEMPEVDGETIVQCFNYLYDPSSSSATRKQADQHLLHLEANPVALLTHLLAIFEHNPNPKLCFQALVYSCNVLKRNWSMRRYCPPHPGTTRRTPSSTASRRSSGASCQSTSWGWTSATPSRCSTCSALWSNWTSPTRTPPFQASSSALLKIYRWTNYMSSSSSSSKKYLSSHADFHPAGRAQGGHFQEELRGLSAGTSAGGGQIERRFQVASGASGGKWHADLGDGEAEQVLRPDTGADYSFGASGLHGRVPVALFREMAPQIASFILAKLQSLLVLHNGTNNRAVRAMLEKSNNRAIQTSKASSTIWACSSCRSR